MIPYFQDGQVTIYHGDAREILPQLEPADAIITDPVWPQNTIPEFSEIDPYELFREVAAHFPRLCRRAVVHLGCASDPRILSGVPAALPFLRVNWLRFRPSYRGRLLIGADVTYAFGEPPPPRPGHIVIPGEMRDYARGKDSAVMDWRKKKHPCPRIFQTVTYLIDIFTAPGETVLDPFGGQGTTARAAKELGRKCILIEIEEKYCELAVQNLSQEVLRLETP